MHFLQAINSDLTVLIVCNKTGGTIKGDIKKIRDDTFSKKSKHISVYLIPVQAGNIVDALYHKL
jgi:hypothetical protein